MDWLVDAIPDAAARARIFGETARALRELGHVVTTNKNVPFARRCERFPKFEMFYLVMREADLAGSETLAEQLRAGERRIMDVGGDTGYQHQVAENENGEWTTRKKQSVFVNDCW